MEIPPLYYCIADFLFSRQIIAEIIALISIFYHTIYIIVSILPNSFQAIKQPLNYDCVKHS